MDIFHIDQVAEDLERLGMLEVHLWTPIRLTYPTRHVVMGRKQPDEPREPITWRNIHP
jgi:hypothetical protein